MLVWTLKSFNLIALEHFGAYLKMQIFPKYGIIQKHTK